jgi:type IV secretion system protein VirD4
MTNHAIEVVFAPKEQDVANELSERIGYDTVQAKSRSRPWGLSAGKRSESVSDQRRALMLPQELKLIPSSKAFILATSVPPLICDKIIYYEDAAFTARLKAPPIIAPNRGPSNMLLASEIIELKSAVAELQATFRTRPMTDEEIADPSLIPDDATFDFGDVPVDLEGLSEDELKDWCSQVIDAAIIPTKETTGSVREMRRAR